jgi:molybdopterin-guanine dinucleotide biosynthesis protein MobB
VNQLDYAAPVVACCGFSGSGKTTLIEALVPLFRARGLSVAVVKHDAHGVQLDRPGKDSDRLFRAGASVLLRGANESAARWHPDDGPTLEEGLRHLGANHDLVLVEGHKQTELPKLWLLADGEDAPPGDVQGIIHVLPRDEARIEAAVGTIGAFLHEAWMQRRIQAGILVGGQSTRMGSPKQLLDHGGRTLVHRAIDGLDTISSDPVLLGSGRVPDDLAGARRLPDVPGIAGPLGGLMAALRWAPTETWLMVACDQPLISRHAVDWLMAQRRPGRWAVMPRLGDGPVEPFLAVYEPQSLSLLERLARSGAFGPWRIAGHEKVASPEPPADLAACWRNVNTPEEFNRLSE